MLKTDIFNIFLDKQKFDLFQHSVAAIKNLENNKIRPKFY